MRIQLILFAVLFVVIFVMHKPFDVHSSRRRWLVRLHVAVEWLWTALAMWLAWQWGMKFFK